MAAQRIHEALVMHRLRRIVVWVAAVGLIGVHPLWAQSFRRAGTEFNAMRAVSIPPGKAYAVVVTQFFHHGEIAADGRNVFVLARNQKPVPSRVLQLGPGDFCRVAFQTLPGQNSYEILYGGNPPEKDAAPAWTFAEGLLLETHEFKRCNLQSLDSVREAYNSSKAIGADYVAGVHQAGNPFALKPGPFLSRYSGTLHAASNATYGFFTSSQDCSFLLIDGKLVVDAPGTHGPAHQARPGSRKDVKLSAGPHKFEYYHAATGSEAVMAAAWEVQPAEPRPKPAAIPPEAFSASAIGHEPAGPVSLRTEKVPPDFVLEIIGSVPLPDNDVPLVGVRFIDETPRALSSGAKYLWDFGDGQTSELAKPVHVYLRPGLYTVKLTIRRGGKPFEIANRIEIDQPRVTDRKEFHQLDEYLATLENYDPRTLDAVALRQLVLAYQAKADAVVAAADEKAAADKKNEEYLTEREAKKRQDQANLRKAEAGKYLAAAAKAARDALAEQSAAKGDEDLVRLARLAGPIARDQLGDFKLAGQIWLGASKKVTASELKAECQAELADIAVNDLADAAAGKRFLDAATTGLGSGRRGLVPSRLQRIWGDYYGLVGDGKAARKAYAAAESLLDSRRNSIERTAWQGAHGRSTEQFLKTRELDRAAAELRLWQDEFPGDKITGYITLLTMRYWIARELYSQAIAHAGQLVAVNGDSAYLDQALFLAADCHLKLGATDRAIATLQSLSKDQPGSPLVPQAKEKLTRLQSGEKPRSEKTGRAGAK
jgi:PKD domain/PA14 domain